MNLTLNILDTNKNPLDVGNILIQSTEIDLTELSSDFVAIPSILLGNNTYRIVFPATSNPGILGIGDSCIQSPDDVTLNVLVPNSILLNGGFVDITPSQNINTLEICALTSVGSYPTETIEIYGEDITITIDDGNTVQVFQGVNSVTTSVVNNSNTEITVESTGLHTYSNFVQLYHYDIEANILMVPVITDPNDPNYRRAYPCFFYILEPCSYNIHVYNGQSAPYGMISYYHSQDSNKVFATGNNGVLDTCLPDIVSITQRIVVREIANCGGTSPIIWDEVFTIDGIQTTEYKPSLQLEREFNCCEIIGTEVVIIPREIFFNIGPIHNVCDASSLDPALTYTLTSPQGEEILLASYNGTEVNDGVDSLDLSALGFSFTPNELGTYSLVVSISNCCTTTEQIYKFDVCNSWSVTNTDCNIIEISNYSSINNLTFTIKELTQFSNFSVLKIDDVVQQDIIVGPGTSTKIDLQVDNIYTITVVDNLPSTLDKQYVFVLDCNIKKCKKQLLLDYLCDGGEECNELTRNKLADNWLRFSSLENIVYHKWDEWKQQQSIYNTLSVNDIMEDVITIGKAIDIMNSICKSCGIKNDCSCEKRYTCNYTITNFGYLVPTRYASIIVPKNGTDCGCK